MALFGNRVKETTDTTGTGTLDLNGAPTGFRGFADEFTTLDASISYLIVDDPDNPTEYEYGKGTFTTGTPNTFARDTVEGSSNSGSKVSWAAGTKTIIATPTATDFDNISGAGIQTWAKGADIASASPLVLGSDGNYFDVTGTTGFAAITVAAGVLFMLQFDGALTITQGAGITTPGALNIVTAAGDHLLCFSTAANTVAVIGHFPAPMTQAQAEAGTDTVPRKVSAARIAQAIAALASGSVACFDFTDTTDISLSAAPTQANFGATQAITIPTKGLIKMAFIGRLLADAGLSAGEQVLVLGIRIGTTNYFPTFNDNGSVLYAGLYFGALITSSQYAEVTGFAQTASTTDAVPMQVGLDIEALSIPTGAQTVQVVVAAGVAGSTLKGTVTTSRIHMAVENRA